MSDHENGKRLINPISLLRCVASTNNTALAICSAILFAHNNTAVPPCNHARGANPPISGSASHPCGSACTAAARARDDNGRSNVTFPRSKDRSSVDSNG